MKKKLYKAIEFYRMQRIFSQTKKKTATVQFLLEEKKNDESKSEKKNNERNWSLLMRDKTFSASKRLYNTFYQLLSTIRIAFVHSANNISRSIENINQKMSTTFTH